MPFVNQEFAGDGRIVLNQIQSQDFNASLVNQAGWQLSKDGTATLIGIDVRQINLRIGTLGTANFDLDKWVNGMAIAQNVQSYSQLATYITTTSFVTVTDGTTFPTIGLLSPGGGFSFTGTLHVIVSIALDLTAPAVPTGLFDAKLVKNGSSVGQGMVVDFRDRAAGVRETHSYVYEAVTVGFVTNAPQSTLDIQLRHTGVNPYTVSTSNSIINMWGFLDMSDFTS